MGVSKKGRRAICYKGMKFVWWVKKEADLCDEPWLTVVSMDKRIILSYRVGEGDFFVISKGMIFQGKETSGEWERYWYPMKQPPMIITPSFVQNLILWAVDGRGAQKIGTEKMKENASGCEKTKSRRKKNHEQHLR
ncbi:MAG: hypothetical protein Q4F29_11990 [Lachnospiraceae bacterium]|nr:hypothetical protein [Lachnospiraceae bacterium]